MNEVYEKLIAPFEQIYQKQGLSYVTGEQVTSRLNEALGWDAWSFRILEHGYNVEADELWCLGELTIPQMAPGVPIMRQQFGSQKPNRYTERKDQGGNVLNPQQAGKIIDHGFDLKGAATDALKKCATLIGVGLYLYEKDSPGAAHPSAPPAAVPPKKPNLWEYLEGLGHRHADVVVMSDKMFGNRDIAKLSKEQATRLVVALEDAKKKEEPAPV